LEAARQSLFWVTPERQFWQAIQLIFAILEDTDLLSKISWRDIHAVGDLLNLLASLDKGIEVEAIHFDDLRETEVGATEAAARLLKAPLLQGFIRFVYEEKERDLTENILRAGRGEPSTCFQDVKIQNGCAVVTQLKVFQGNWSTFESERETLQREWVQRNLETVNHRPELDLYLFMVSTIPGVDGNAPSSHQDELWIWVPSVRGSQGHLRVFLGRLAKGPLQKYRNQCIATIRGAEESRLESIVREAMEGIPVRVKTGQDSTAMILLQYPEGVLNSRKATITPNLPQSAKG
jgi:hypothetical protein